MSWICLASGPCGHRADSGQARKVMRRKSMCSQSKYLNLIGVVDVSISKQSSENRIAQQGSETKTAPHHTNYTHSVPTVNVGQPSLILRSQPRRRARSTEHLVSALSRSSKQGEFYHEWTRPFLLALPWLRLEIDGASAHSTTGSTLPMSQQHCDPGLP